MKPTLPILLTLAICLSGCGKKDAATEKEPEPVLTVEAAVATVKTVRELLPIDGSYVLSASDFAKLAPVTAGKLRVVLVKEGDKVKQGQLLAKIDTSVLDAQRSSASANSASALAQASQSESALKAAQSDYRSSVTAAELTLQATIAEQNSAIDQAKIDLEKLRAGSRPQEISQAQQAVRQAQVTRDTAYANAERDKKLLAEGYVSGQQADASQAALEVADSALVQAKDQLQLVRLGARQEDVRAAEVRLSSAKDLGDKRIRAARAALDQARKSKLSLDAKSQEVMAARLAAAGKSADALAASGLAAQGEIRAPFDGTISRRLVGPGSSVDATTPVFEIAKKGAHIEFSGQVSPRAGADLHEGMAVLPEGSQDPSGSLRSIGVTDPQTGQMPIRIIFQSVSTKISAGLFSRVQVVLRKYLDAVTVPESAIVTRDDKKVLFIVESGTAKMQEVEVGPTEDGNVVILKGLKSGQKVVLVGGHELSDGAKIEEANTKDSKKDEAGK